jgi:predicted lipoprotein with Yx(FWY)xxD motif
MSRYAPYAFVLLAALATGCRSEQSKVGEAPGTPLAVANSEVIGRYLSNSEGRPVYARAADEKNTSGCYDACAAAWTPVPGSEPAAPSAEPAIQPELLGSTLRRDGIRQLTYAGLPLYFAVNADRTRVERSLTDQWGTWSLVFPHGERMVP